MSDYVDRDMQDAVPPIMEAWMSWVNWGGGEEGGELGSQEPHSATERSLWPAVPPANYEYSYDGSSEGLMDGYQAQDTGSANLLDQSSYCRDDYELTGFGIALGPESCVPHPLGQADEESHPRVPQRVADAAKPFSREHFTVDHNETHPVSGGSTLPNTGCESQEQLELNVVPAPLLSSEQSLKCRYEECRSKPAFKRKGDLTRHMKKHTTCEQLACNAIGCPRVGAKGFYREDKLGDHIFKGHTRETLFLCPVRGCLGDERTKTRDLMAIHLSNHTVHIYASARSVMYQVSRRRRCPFERCAFSYGSETMDNVQAHLLQAHTGNARAAFAHTLAEHGYDHSTGRPLCPVCKTPVPDHLSFLRHLVSEHLENPVLAQQFELCDIVCRQYYYSRNKGRAETFFRDTRVTHGDLYRCRRTILNLCPPFAYHRVFDDVLPTVERSSLRY